MYVGRERWLSIKRQQEEIKYSYILYNYFIILLVDRSICGPRMYGLLNMFGVSSI